MDYIAHEAPLPMKFSSRNTRVVCHDLLQGIFLTQGSNLGLPHCRQILYHLSHQFQSNPLTPSFLIFLTSSHLGGKIEQIKFGNT